MPDFLLIAHRGDSDNAPDNTLPAFDLALQQGFTHFETDCQLSADGQAIILHDEKLGRTNNGAPGTLAWELSCQQLQQLDAGAWFNARFAGTHIPTLQQLLDAYKDKAHIHLELKSQQTELPAVVAQLVVAARLHPPPTTTAAAAAAAAAAAHGSCLGGLQRHNQVPGLTITSFHLQQVAASKKLLPALPHAWLIQEVEEPALEQTVAAGLDGVCPRANALTPEGVAAAHAKGLYVRAWGVKTLELLHHVVACGAQGATVNWPGRARQALQQAAASQA